MVARRAHNPKVTGSSPVPATKKDDLSLYDSRPFLFSSIPDDRERITPKKELILEV